MAKNNKPETAAAPEAEKPKERRWMRPNTRAKGYAEERKEKKHKFGKQKGEELDPYNQGLRSGYLLSMSDHAGSYIFDKVLAETKDKDKAFEESKKIGAYRKNKKGGEAA